MPAPTSQGTSTAFDAVAGRPGQPKPHIGPAWTGYPVDYQNSWQKAIRTDSPAVTQDYTVALSAEYVEMYTFLSALVQPMLIIFGPL